MKVRDLGERGLIAAIHRLQKSPPRGYLGIGDDAAVLPANGQGWLVSTDMLVEGIHFDPEWTSPGQLGEKAVAVNVSDIAAMGGTPRGLLTSLSLPGHLPVAWVEAFYRGLAKALDEYGAVLLGGDTVGSLGPVVISVTVLGQAVEADPVLRQGARPGDRLVVTGRIGAARAGLALLRDGVRWPGRNVAERSVLTAQLLPKARVEAGLRLASLAHAMTDLSDGLVAELLELTQFGGVGAKVWEDRLPVDGATREVAGRYRVEPSQWAYYGGEDFELLAAVPPSRVEEARRRLAECQLTLTEIGVITDVPGVVAVRPGGREEPLSEGEIFDHFHLDHSVGRS
ncbi:MAG: thiamine-phosphate kinase [Firmicutes bacterium]|nr:thiamine-phosphate kinase [Alicyclobacillaceae bacterium]MCL6497457.1 thiamine-phosphate kinase [Bacillota bacterium]